jgi:hypothetical protein
MLEIAKRVYYNGAHLPTIETSYKKEDSSPLSSKFTYLRDRPLKVTTIQTPTSSHLS